MQYARDVALIEVKIDGWQAWMLVDAWPNGQPRPIALLDEEALERINAQTAAALATIRGEAS